jgi:hypothetical protein
MARWLIRQGIRLYLCLGLPGGLFCPSFPTKFLYTFLVESRDSSVGIALGHGMDDRGSRVRFQTGAGNFSFHHRIQTGFGAHSASYLMATRGSFLGVKRPGREADHSPPSSAEVKECVRLYLHSPTRPSWCASRLKKEHRDNLTLLLHFLYLPR